MSRVQFLAWYPWSGLARIFIFLRKEESFFSTRLGCGSKIPDDRDRDGSFTLLPFVSGDLAGIVFLVYILFGVWSILMVSAFAGSWCLCLSLAKAHCVLGYTIFACPQYIFSTYPCSRLIVVVAYSVPSFVCVLHGPLWGETHNDAQLRDTPGE